MRTKIHRFLFCISCLYFMSISRAENSSFIVKVAKSPEQRAEIESFCLKLQQINQEYVGVMLKEMEETPFAMRDFFEIPQCQPDGYSNTVHSPLLYLVADDPTERIVHLRKISAYFSRKGNSALFSSLINAINTKGETILDYIEWINLTHQKIESEQQDALNEIISFSCSHGAVYLTTRHKKCPG